ncbi:hypothetical protein [Salinispora sp. H7-4]|uniref:Rv0361 family membrane protein n=1 Tax=Salinispora sp. H7-4 TaxID=2748321 RepID=UPI0015D30720|nr:hypothetical protein [Salinispora sp. H7-4]NYT96043.1 hypothetical protein [Salinispora sp. H7-4]
MSQSASDDPTHQPDHPAAPDAPAPHPSAFPTPAAPDAPAPYPAAFPTPATPYPPNQQSPAPRRRRGFLIASIALAVTLVLCVGGGVAAFLVLRTEEGPGAEEPKVAVDEFLTAVYKDRDAAQASSLVCPAARNQDKISAKVTEVEKYVADYEKPHFRWNPPKIDDETEDRAVITTTVIMTTADEQVAELPLRLTVVKTTGWRVCEVAGE